MLSLFLWTTLIIADVLLTAAVIAWAARAVGSQRGRFRVGLLAVLMLVGLNLATTAISLAVGEPATMPGMVAAALFWLVVQMVMIFIVLQKTFQVSFGRTFAPFGALLAVGIFFFILVLAVLRPYVSQAYRIPSGSMSPTLEPGARIFVNKLAHPHRWDIITYWNISPSDQDRSLYCKRVIGLPGEQLRFDHGQIYINEQVQTAPAVLAGHLTTSLPHGVSRYRDGETIRLGPAEIFVVGDNLPLSADSRYYGPTNTSNVVGVVDLQYWPLSKFGVK
jgi:signal peptidase I